MPWNNKEFVQQYLRLFVFLVIILIFAAIAVFYRQEISARLGLQNLGADLLQKYNVFAENEKPQNFYKTERLVKAVVLSQIKHPEAAINSQNLQKAVLALFNNLKDQDYQSLIIIADPSLPENESDPFYEQAKFIFPDAHYTIIRVEKDQNETDLLAKIKAVEGINPLIVLHSYISDLSADPLLKEIQQNHFKNVYDNLSKSGLLSLGYTNKEALKAVYQYSKENGYLKDLPTLFSSADQYQIKYLASGRESPSKIATLTFFGDMMLGRHVRTLMNSTTLDYPFLKMDQSYLQKNDLLIANLEGPIAQKAISTTKSIAFRFMPDVAPLLAKYHFDLLSTANNHALDMGQQGLNDTLKILPEVGITPFGNTRSEAENLVVKKNVNGLNFAFIGLNHTDFKVKQETVVQNIRALKAEGYLVIPYIHWGVEYQHTPSKEQIEMAHAYVDAGAAAVIGMHPHVVQSFEIYKDKPIFYSLGNAIFDQYFSPDVQEGLTATLRFTPEQLEIYFIPIKIERSQFLLMKAEQKADFLRRFTGYWRYDQTIKDQIEKGKIVITIPKSL